MASVISQPPHGYVREQASKYYLSPVDEVVALQPAGFEGANIVAIIPAYNEERFIGSVVLKTLRYTPNVIVVDDGSSDATAQIAEAAGAMVVRHSTNHGKGAALMTAFQATRELRPDVVVMLDADGQHLPEEITKVIQPVLDGQADITIGSRYLEHTSEVPRLRSMGHWAFNLLTRLSSGEKASDSQSGYRAFSPRALECLDFSSKGFSVESEMQFQAHQNGLKLVEVPITIQYLDKPKRPVLSHGLSVLNGVLRLTGQYRPLLFFGLPGMLALLGGLGMGVVVVNIYSRIQQLAVGYAMISVLLTVTGMLGLATGIILHSVRGLLTDMLQNRR
jgi:glycosyltransferase involved in cell wall biosynthesis